MIFNGLKVVLIFVLLIKTRSGNTSFMCVLPIYIFFKIIDMLILKDKKYNLKYYFYLAVFIPTYKSEAVGQQRLK